MPEIILIAGAAVVILILVISFLAYRYLRVVDEYQGRHEAIGEVLEGEVLEIRADTLDRIDLREIEAYPLGSLYVAAAETAAEVAAERWQNYLDGEDQADDADPGRILHPNFDHVHWWWYGQAWQAEARDYHDRIDAERRAWRHREGLPLLELAEVAA